MEENQEKVKSAAADKLKEVDNVVLDQEKGQVIDIDDILEMQEPIVFKLNRLTKFGITNEMIKEVYGASPSISGGEDLRLALDTLEIVYNVLVDSLNRLPNGIIIDVLTGELDEDATLEHREKIGLDPTTEPVLNDKNKEFLLVDALKDILPETWQIKEERKEIENIMKEIYDDKNFDSLNRKKLWEDLGFNEEEQEQIAYQRENTRIMEKNETQFIRMLYKLESLSEDDPKRAELIGEIKVACQLLSKEDWRNKLLDENGKFDLSKTHDFLKWFENEKNEADIMDALANAAQYQMKDGETDKFYRLDVLKRVALAVHHMEHLDEGDKDDNHQKLKRLTQRVAEKFGVSMDLESIQKAIEEITGGKYSSREAFIKTLETHTFNKDSAHYKLAKIDEDIDRRQHGGSTKTQDDFVREKQIRTVLTAKVYAALNSQIKKIDGDGRDFRGHQLIDLYKFYHDELQNHEKDSFEYRRAYEAIDIVESYMIDNHEFLEEYFGKRFSRSIFRDGRVSIDEVNAILEMSAVPKEFKQAIANVKGRVTSNFNEIEKIKNDKENQKKLEDLRKLLDGKDGITARKEKTILKLLDTIDVGLISRDDYEKLITSDRLKAKLEELVSGKGIASKAKTLRMNERSKEDILIERVIILEEKIKNSQVYAKDSKSAEGQIQEIYENNPELRDIIIKLKTENYGVGYEAKREKVLSKMLYDNIDYNTANVAYDTLDDKGKKNYVSWLLVGLDCQDYELQKSCRTKLTILYKDLEEIDPTDEVMFRLRAYQKMNPSISSLDETIDVSDELRDNLLTTLLNNRKINTDKITDENMDLYYEENQVQIDASAIDLSSDIIKRMFRDSKISFSDNDAKLFEDLYSKTTIDSWLDNKKAAIQLTYASLVEASERVQRQAEEKGQANEKEDAYKRRLNNLLAKYPNELAEILDKKGDVKPSFKEKANDFTQIKIKSEVLQFFEKSAAEEMVYPNLPDPDKRAFLRHAMIAMDYAKNTKDPEERKMFTKLALRSFESMKHDGKTFLDNVPGKGYVINEKNVLEEYNSLSRKDLQATTYKEAVEINNTRVYGYTALVKLMAYTNREENGFFKLVGKSVQEKIAEIKQIKKAHKEEVIQRRMMLAEERRKKQEEKAKAKGAKGENKEKEKNEEPIAGYKFEEIDTSAIDERVKTADNIEEASVVTMKEPRPDETQEQKPSETSSRFEQAEPQDEDYKVAINDAKEEKGLKAFFKRTWEKITNKRLGTGQEENKKPGFFARLFNRKEDTTPITEETTSIKSPVQENKTFADYIKVENQNASVEHGAMDASAKGVDGAKNNAAGKGQPETEEISQE